jgi:NADH-quinone oxidoreductase subunit M
VLAAVLLKLGTYGLVRIAMPMFPDALRSWAVALVVLGVVSALWGALAALAQTDLKRMVAYSSVNHMGYVVLAVGAAGLVSAGSDDAARATAVSGAVTQMVSHGLLTGALFLLAGVVWRRTRDYDLDAYGGWWWPPSARSACPVCPGSWLSCRSSQADWPPPLGPRPRCWASC